MRFLSKRRSRWRMNAAAPSKSGSRGYAGSNVMISRRTGGLVDRTAWRRDFYGSQNFEQESAQVVRTGKDCIDLSPAGALHERCGDDCEISGIEKGFAQ